MPAWNDTLAAMSYAAQTLDNADNSHVSRLAMVLNSQGGDAGRVSRVFARPASALPVRHAGIRWKQFLPEDFAHGTAASRKHKLTDWRLTYSMTLTLAPTRAAFDRPINSVAQRRLLVAPHRRCQGLHLYNVMRAVLIPNNLGNVCKRMYGTHLRRPADGVTEQARIAAQ